MKVKPLKKGNEHVVKTTRGETVLSLKEKLEEVGGYPVNTQRLVLKGKALVNNKTIGDYGISEGTVVHLLEKAPEAEDKEKVGLSRQSFLFLQFLIPFLSTFVSVFPLLDCRTRISIRSSKV